LSRGLTLMAGRAVAQIGLHENQGRINIAIYALFHDFYSFKWKIWSYTESGHYVAPFVMQIFGNKTLAIQKAGALLI